MDNARLDELERDIADIKARNCRVEIDKRWEQSRTRVAALTIGTYLLTALVFYLLDNSQYLRNACIPALGYNLSTHSLPFLKRWWVARFGR